MIQHSGRAGDALLVDSEWRRLLRGSDHGQGAQLVALPDDPQTVRAFVGVGEPPFPAADRERIGRMIHEAYRARARRTYLLANPSMEEFDGLPDGLRESNQREADHILTKMREIDAELVPLAGAAPFELDEREVERLAEMEHGRWNAERLAAGFEWGEDNDAVARTHPYLVPWSQLPETVKDIDRDAVRKDSRAVGGDRPRGSAAPRQHRGDAP